MSIIIGEPNLCMYNCLLLSKTHPKALVTPPGPVIPTTLIFKIDDIICLFLQLLL